MRRLTSATLTAVASFSLTTTDVVWSDPLLAQTTPQRPASNTAPKTAPTSMVRDTAKRTPGVSESADGFRFDFQDADIRGVITALATAGGLNVVYGDLPQKKVSLRLNNPVQRSAIPQVLRDVALSNGLRVSEENGLISVSATPVREQPRRGPNFEGTELFVYRLRHANATVLSGVLQGIFNSTGSSARPNTNTGLSRQGGGNLQGGPSGGLGGGGGGGGGTNRRLGGGGGGGGGIDGGGISITLPQQGGNGGGGIQPFRFPFFGGQNAAANQSSIVIVPDEATNSLLVRASPDDWDIIKQAIEAVDLRPSQVVIEVMIAEVRRSDDLKVGVSGTASNQRTATGNTTGSVTLGPAPDTTDNFIARLTRMGNVDINLAVTALKQRGDVRVLSLPLVFAQNNKESVLLVGSQRPFVQTYRTLATDNSARDQVVQYREVGTVLDILPTINPDGYVNLQVYQEVSSATNEVQFGAPVISTRQASASVFVRDGQTVVVGGLTDRQQQKIKSGIPLLSEIPFIGALFGTTQTISERTELYLFLTPHIVMTDADAQRVREEIGAKSELLHAIPVDSVRLIDSVSPLTRPEPDPTQNQTPAPQQQQKMPAAPPERRR